MTKKRNNTGDISLSTSLDGLFEQPKKGLFYDDKGNKVEKEYYQGPKGTHYTYDDNYNAIPLLMFAQMSPQEFEKWRTTAPNSPYKKGMKEVQKRQAMMRAAGLDVPDNGLWDDAQQAAWNKLTTKPKDYDTTLTDLAQAAYDKATGNDTYKDNPFLQEEVKTYDPNNVDWSKTRRSQSAIINAMEGTWGPIVATALAPTLLKAAISAPLATLATTIGGSLGGKAVDKASEAITGRDFSTNVAMYSPLTPEMGEILNPGYTAGGIYGNFVRNNLKNRGRYTLNYLNPASYKGHLLDLPSTFAAPFYRKPPTFYNGRKPAWYNKYVSTYGTEAAENRFQNGAIWAGISEDEVPITMYRKNYDGTYRMTNEGIGPRYFNLSALPDETTIEADLFTKGMIGGEHSNYTKLAEQNGIKLMEFRDEQKLNPQWQIADRLKKKFHIEDGSKAQKVIDNFGGYPLDGIVGYKPFTIKQNYLHDGNNVLPVFMDPIDPYLPVPINGHQ